MLLHCTNDVERIGDHAEIIHAVVLRLRDEGLRFSSEAEAEYDRLHDVLAALTHATVDMLENPTEELRAVAAGLQEQMQTMLEHSETKHFARISNGECRPQVGMLFLELVEEMRKISRHLENIHDRASMFYGKFPNPRKIAEQQARKQRESAGA